MSSIARQAARGTLFLGVAHASLTAAGYVVAVLLARGLGPVDYGVYGIVYSILMTIEVIARIGIPQAVSRLIAEAGDRAPRMAATGVTLTFGVYLVVFAIFWIAAPALADIFNVPNGAWLFRIAAIDIPFYGGYIIAAHILNGRRTFGPESVAVLLYSLVKVVGITIVFLHGATVVQALLVNALSSVVAFAWAAWAGGRDSFVPTLAHSRTVIRLAVPVAIAGLGVQLLMSIDLWALNAVGWAVPRATKGLYVAATNLGRMPTVMSFVMQAVLIPTIARAIGMGDRAQARRTVLGAMRFLAITLVPVATIVAVEAEPLLELMFTDSFAAGAPLLRLLVFAHGLGNTIFATLCGILLAAGEEKVSARVALAAAGAALIVDPLLVLALGAIGAALGALLTTAGAVLATAVLTARQTGPLIEMGVLARTVAATAVVAVIAWYVPAHGLMLLIELFVLGLVYLALLPPFRLVTRADLAVLLPGKATDGTA
jgi:O-antigen/teichoic acid export membrane protein